MFSNQVSYFCLVLDKYLLVSQKERPVSQNYRGHFAIGTVIRIFFKNPMKHLDERKTKTKTKTVQEIQTIEHQETAILI